MASLVSNSPGSSRTYSLDADETIIGRSAGLAVTLDGANISRKHARILRSGSQFIIEDLGSSNGTYLNDRRLSAPASLHANDLLRFGPFSFRFQLDPIPSADLTIHRETVATPANLEIFTENAALKLRAVLELAHELGSTLDIDPLLNRFLDQLLKLFPKAERALVLFLENDEPVVRLVRDRRQQPGSEQLFSRSVLKQVTQKGAAVLAEDARAFQANMTLNALGVRSLLCVPLRAHGTPVFGAVQVDRFKGDAPFTSEDLHLLTAITLQISIVLDKARLHERLLAQERISRELALAREIQLAFLPQSFPPQTAGRIEIIAELQPAQEVSGDFYDYFLLDDTSLVALVADVSGKGIAAALFMSMVRALLRQVARPGLSPGQILHALNQCLVRDNPKFMFVTIALVVYELESGRCRVARAGHPAPLLWTRGGAFREITCPPGCLLGIADDCAVTGEIDLQLAPGEMLLLYTDGVTEAAEGGTGPLFGPDRLIQTVARVASDSPLKEFARSLHSEVARYSGAGGAQDDLTLLFLRRI